MNNLYNSPGDIEGALPFSTIDRISPLIKTHIEGESGQWFYLSSKGAYNEFSEFFEWVLSNEDLFKSVEKQQAQHYHSVASSLRDSTYAGGRVTYEYDEVVVIQKFLDKYTSWLNTKKQEILFGKKLGEMTGYEFQAFASSIGLIK